MSERRNLLGVPVKPGGQLHWARPARGEMHVPPFRQRLLHDCTGTSQRSPVHCGGQLHYNIPSFHLSTSCKGSQSWPSFEEF